ncbi:unnamed protein product, partial [Choristocarpus tenellus]
VVDDLSDWVHVDEKWFYILKDGQGVYLHSTEKPPIPPRAKNKNYVMKVMFLAAVARPRKLSNGMWFSGRIGIWPIMDTKVTQCSSKQCPKGSKVLVPATVGVERYKKLMMEDIILAIKARVP